MNVPQPAPISATRPTFAELFTPKLVTVLREGYSEFLALLRSSPADALVLLSTFLLTVFVDLTTAIAVGVVLGAFLILHRMAETVEVASGIVPTTEDRADTDVARATYDADEATDPDVMVYRISGVLFFGATTALSTVLDRVGSPPKAFVLDFSNVPLIDSTAANALRGFVRKLERSGTRIYFAGVRTGVMRTLAAAGLPGDTIQYATTIAAALQQIKTNP